MRFSFGFVSSLLFSGLTFAVSAALACSAFRLPVVPGHSVFVGRNFDWGYGHGLIVVNKRGVAKHALAMHASDTAEWVSRYGSLTFNQVGREFPYGGVNEKGLMIEVLWLGWTAWPKNQTPSINEVQWIQYQLDTRDSVADLAAHIEEIRILPLFAKVHFFACDSSGECATIEGLGSHVKIHRGLDVNALTNDPYESSVAYRDSLSSCPTSGHTDGGSLDRFARASCLARQPVSVGSEITEASRYLDLVDQGTYTKWKIVYDLTNRSITLRTQDAPVAKSVSLQSFDLSCGTPVRVLDMNFEGRQAGGPGRGGDVTGDFLNYSESANRAIVEASVLKGFAHLPKPVVDKIVAFPDTLTCSVR